MVERCKRAVRKTAAALLLAATACWAGAPGNETSNSAHTQNQASRLLRSLHAVPGIVVQVSAGMHGDVFPAFANRLSLELPVDREWGVVQVAVANPGDAGNAPPLRLRVSVRITGWSDEEIQNLELAPGLSKTLDFAPTLGDRAFRNREITPATAQVRVTGADENLIFASTVPLHIRAVEDMLWVISSAMRPISRHGSCRTTFRSKKLWAAPKSTCPEGDCPATKPGKLLPSKSSRLNNKRELYISRCGAADSPMSKARLLSAVRTSKLSVSAFVLREKVWRAVRQTASMAPSCSPLSLRISAWTQRS